MNPDSTNNRIKELREGTAKPIENAPGHQIVGTDGSGWYQQVGHDHDVHSVKADSAELRQELHQKIALQIQLHRNKPQRGLFLKLDLAVARSDSAMFRASELVGVKPSAGLYERIKEILVTEEDLDPNSELWKLWGVNL